MEPAGDWCLIESDPGVFTALIKDFGVEGVQVEEVFSLDSDSFKNLKPIHGLIFLFKCIQDDGPEGSVVQDSRLDKIFFPKQVISNACATQAIISILLNTVHDDVKLGSTLQDFKDFTQTFDSGMKGLTLSNSKLIREVHNSYARQQIFEYDEKAPRTEDSYHFIGYMPIEGRLYELDGLKPGPIDHGAIETEDWLDSVRPVIEKRISRYTAGEIHFNLMAVVGDKLATLEKQLTQLKQKLADCQQQPVDSMETDGNEVDRPEVIQAEIEECVELMNEEQTKRQKFRLENIRRKHNYLPLIVEMLRILAAEGKLLPLIESAKRKANEKPISSSSSH